jgi:hypothetical protein
MLRYALIGTATKPYKSVNPMPQTCRKDVDHLQRTAFRHRPGGRSFRMRGAMMKFKQTGKPGWQRLKSAALLGLAALALSGCVVYPSSGYGYGGGYYAAPAYYAPPVVVGVGGGWGWGRGCCWGRGGWR